MEGYVSHQFERNIHFVSHTCQHKVFMGTEKRHMLVNQGPPIFPQGSFAYCMSGIKRRRVGKEKLGGQEAEKGGKSCRT